MSSTGFQRGAGVEMGVSNFLFGSSLGFVLIIVTALVLIGVIKAWAKGDLQVSDLVKYVIRALLFMALVAVLIGL